MRIAVLGTGLMGAPMARRLAEAGRDVRACNRTRAKAEELGATVASTPAEALADAEFVVTMLADGPAVDEVMRDASEAAVPGTIWVQTSTVGVDWTRRLAVLASDGLEPGLGPVTLERMNRAIDLGHEDMAAMYYATRPDELDG